MQTYEVSLRRLLPVLGALPVEELDAERIAELVGAMHADGLKKQTIRKTVSVLAMILGEYLVHGWDLARALDLPWSPAPEACEAALEFFRAMIAPEYRGGDAGYFGPEVTVAAGAGTFERLLGFAGRDPRWPAGR